MRTICAVIRMDFAMICTDNLYLSMQLICIDCIVNYHNYILHWKSHCTESFFYLFNELKCYFLVYSGQLFILYRNFVTLLSIIQLISKVTKELLTIQWSTQIRVLYPQGIHLYVRIVYSFSYNNILVKKLITCFNLVLR